MSTPRKVGIFLCLAGFLAVCVLALVLPSERPFAGLPGIENNLAEQAEAVLAPVAPRADITVSGRDIEVQLPELVNPTFDRARLQTDLSAIDGVRKVELLGDPTVIVAGNDGGEPQEAEPTAVPTQVAEPTAAPTPAQTPEPTVAPEPAEPTPDPNAAPEQTVEPTVEPTTAPLPTATPTPKTLVEVVADIDLESINFVGNTARLSAQDIGTLDTVADQLQGLTGGPVQIQAHTDNVGDPDVNLLLSQDRAQAIRNYLIERGVDASLLTARGFGASAPLASNSTEQGRAANQRVELVVEGN